MEKRTLPFLQRLFPLLLRGKVRNPRLDLQLQFYQPFRWDVIFFSWRKFESGNFLSSFRFNCRKAYLRQDLFFLTFVIIIELNSLIKHGLGKLSDQSDNALHVQLCYYSYPLPFFGFLVKLGMFWFVYWRHQRINSLKRNSSMIKVQQRCKERGKLNTCVSDVFCSSSIVDKR